MIVQQDTTGFNIFEAIRDLEFWGSVPAILLPKLGSALLIVVLAWLTIRALRILTRRLERRLADEEDGERPSEHEQRAQTLTQLLYSVASIVIVVTAALLVLDLFVPIGPLLAGVGVFGLAVSFGAQSLVKDVINGFFILSENQIRVGDVVEIDATSGVVERITLRVVMLRDVEGVLHIIPNGAIVKVSNKTRGWSRAVIDVAVAYGEDVDRVIAVLRSESGSFWNDQEWQARLVEEPEVWGVQALADSSVNVRWIAETKPGKQWEVRREMLRRAKNRFDREGIEIPFPQRSVHIREGGPAR